MNRVQLAALLTLGLAGCAEINSPLDVSPPPPPPPVELGAIIGVGAFHTPSGGFGTCAGQSVLLMPDTAESRERITALYGAGHHVVAPVSVVKARQARIGPPPASLVAFPTQCDPAGRFAFKDLAEGPYFLIARVRVRPAQNGQDEWVVLQHLTLETGETRHVGLSE